MIIITGANRGLGNAIANRLNKKGEKVISLVRSPEILTSNIIKCDVTNFDSINNAAKEIKKMKIPIKAFINAAGVSFTNVAISTDQNSIQKLIQTNLIGTINCCQVFAPIMLREKKGSFINFSSIAVKIAPKGESVYAASKAAVETFSRIFAKEVADYNLKVNCISPGPIKTDMIKNLSDEQIENVISQQIISKQFNKSDVCDLVELLLDKRSLSLSGQVLHIGGV